VHRSSNERMAAERTRWLDDLAAAIDDAQRVAWRLGIAEGADGEAMALYGRLEIARTEVEAIRNSGWATMREQFAPDWIYLLNDGVIRPFSLG
jgi:hypothetical protein